jgi:shikimate dehydrogenase
VKTQAILLGYPLGHTISPPVLQAAFDYFDLPLVYNAHQVPPEGLEEAVRALRGPEYIGANVTVPYKERVVPMLDAVVSKAQRAKAVNCIVKERGKLIGHNTDVGGFTKALEQDLGFDAWNKRAVILGAGGAARAVLVALADLEVARVTIANRDLSRSSVLVEEFKDEFSPDSLSSINYADTAFPDLLRECDLLVNATPVGMSTFSTANSLLIDLALLPPKAVVFDLIYNPPVTGLLAAANQRGLQTINGMAMLVYQAVEAFELWTGKQAPVGLMMERARRVLAEH